jgi:pantetheine-phosphate adenylyltransferase
LIPFLVKYRKVATGGTFDHIHRGHKALLDKSFQVGDEVVIGLTSDEFVTRLGKKPDYDYEERKKRLSGVLKKRFPRRKYVIRKLNDYFGPGITSEDVEALVASPETAGRIAIANKERALRGFRPLDLVIIENVLAQDGGPISSTRIRKGEIDEEGKLKKRKLN